MAKYVKQVKESERPRPESKRPEVPPQLQKPSSNTGQDSDRESK
ncbi:MAG: hypothetical protein ACE5NG_18520 [bacterium]